MFFVACICCVLRVFFMVGFGVRECNNAGIEMSGKNKALTAKPKKPKTQAERVFRKFGGPRNLYRALLLLGPEASLNPSTIYRWNYPVAKGGSGGVIPFNAMAKILKAARAYGVYLDGDDFYPGSK
jgi:hypothetical protein